MKPLYATVITVTFTGIAFYVWIYVLYALAKLAIFNPEIRLLATLAISALLGGLVISFIPGIMWDLLTDPDPLEEPEDEEEK